MKHTFVGGMLFIMLFVSLPMLANAAVYADGSVVKSVDGTQVYVLESGEKRWIESEELYFSLGYVWNDLVTVSPHELDLYPEGDPVADSGDLALPPETDLLPDVIPLPATDLHIDTVDGEQVIRFTSTFWNAGAGPLETEIDFENPNEDESLDATQMIRQQDGSARGHGAGVVIFHEGHDHHHLDNFAEYQLAAVSDDKGVAARSQVKASFCLRDDYIVDVSIAGTPEEARYVGCGNAEQGISVGWADRYFYDLEDQYLEIATLPAGRYVLYLYVDPTFMLMEETQVNNVSAVILDLDPAVGSFEVLAALSADDRLEQDFEDGLLVSGDASGRIYVLFDGKKRWLRDEGTFLSYGYSYEDVIELPEVIVNAIPEEDFIRDVNGTVYMLNQHGYVRRILNPEVLASYEANHIPLINETELGTYIMTELIQREGDDRVFSVNSKTLVGLTRELAQMDVDQLAVQTINELDFMSYVVATVAQDLTIPWDVAFLPGGDMLVTERDGTLRRYGSVEAAIEIPDVLHTGEGGLMGIAVHPNFEENQYIYLYHTIAGNGSMNRVVRYWLDGGGLTQDKVILDNIPGAIYHDGGQIEFGPDEKLYITTGDATTPDLAQDLNSIAGKTLRLNDDGSIPSDNPYGDEIWSWGHRNAQGLAWDDQGNLWESEHGRSGALSGYDELNKIDKGANYGWPIIQGGTPYSGMEVPELHSGPNDTWAPSGLAYHEGTLYFSGLRGSRIYAADVSDGNIVRINEYFHEEFGRLRASTIGPDGMLYISTSNQDGRGTVRAGDDKVLKIAPGLLEAL